MITFAAAIFLLIITPGPGVLTTAGVGAAFGMRAGVSYVSGLCVGSNLVSVAVVTGLAAILFNLPGVGPVLLFASAAYLSFLAYKIAVSGSKIAFIRSAKAPGFIDGVVLQFINPKAYVVATTLFSGFAFLPDHPLSEIVLKFIIINAVWIPVHIAWLWAGLALHRMELSYRVQHRINYAMALALICVSALAIVAPR